jgi:methionine sulfoxide reductase heme-binding subunit
VIAYVLLTIGVLWGLVQSGGLFRTRVAPLLAFGLHSYFSWIGLGLAALHAIVLTGDTYTRFSLAQIALPFTANYRPVQVSLGIIGFYLMLLLTLSFYGRRFIGQRTFRLFHYTSFGVFVLVTLHGVLSGTDAGALWWLYSFSLLAVVLLTTMRIVSKRRNRQPSARAMYAVSQGDFGAARPSEAIN